MAMQIHDIKVNDTTVSQEDSTPIVSLNVDIAFLCDGDLSEYQTSSGLDTTTLKDAVLKAFHNLLEPSSK
ncbi:hypothetical protein PQ465_12880 [Sphingobacterium oryzagri]|uniref:Uncharacterized protein n=1 Tax=Sphingobacterium oryzagri TaxID=3025669 RepID=A0ABY7WII3_9SPHI|nr:hypothetical protein [Sphingobacterium sp. KACC 22765]WDF67199.1 hypothetical protein PQ465_12880 [Sphingobacterium sp. KACC 22765]